MRWRVGIIGWQRWAVQGVAQALGRASAPAFEPVTLGLEQLSDPPSLDVLVVVQAANERAAMIARKVPQHLPILWLGETGDTPPHSGPTGRLEAEVDEDVLAAAVHALASGLHVCDAAHRRALPVEAAGTLSEPLTPRELEVLELMAKGLANREIALALGISSHTAKFHVARILEKAGAATRTEAVRQGLRLGLIGL
jgi:DNA-binding CsgD family transcriptional regulator